MGNVMKSEVYSVRLGMGTRACDVRFFFCFLKMDGDQKENLLQRNQLRPDWDAVNNTVSEVESAHDSYS